MEIASPRLYVSSRSIFDLDSILVTYILLNLKDNFKHSLLTALVKGNEIILT